MPDLGVHCQAIMESRHMDVLEMDAASHTGVDDVRQINDSVRYAPASARYKVYIIDEVHMLSTAAFNAFLKTLEEPPEHAKFVFATTEIRKVPVTVLSRCQRFDLRRVEADVLMAHLGNIASKEGVEVEPEALGIIARAAEGSVRNSLSLFDQAIAHAAGLVRADAVRQMLGLADRTRVIDLFEHLARGDLASAFGEFRSQYDVGADPVVVLCQPAVLVDIGGIDAHAGSGDPMSFTATPASSPTSSKCPLPRLAKRKLGTLSLETKQIEPAIIVEVGGHGPPGFAQFPGDTGFLADVGESAVAIVMEEPAGGGRVRIGHAIRAH